MPALTASTSRSGPAPRAGPFDAIAITANEPCVQLLRGDVQHRR
jgi:hypothetical protein